MSELNKQSTPASDWQNVREFHSEFRDKNSRTYTYKIDRENIV